MRHIKNDRGWFWPCSVRKARDVLTNMIGFKKFISKAISLRFFLHIWARIKQCRLIDQYFFLNKFCVFSSLIIKINRHWTIQSYVLIYVLKISNGSRIKIKSRPSSWCPFCVVGVLGTKVWLMKIFKGWLRALSAIIFRL